MRNSLRTLEWTDSLIEALASPRSLAVRFAGNEKQLNASTFLIPLVSSAMMIIALSLLGAQTGYFYYKITYGWIFASISVFINILTSSALTDMVFQFRKKRGNVRRVINIINISYFPKLLLLPLMLCISVTGFAPPFFFVVLYIAAAVWSLYIISRGLSEIYSVDLHVAFLLYMLPYAVTAVLILLQFLLVMFLGYGFIINF